MGLPCLLQQQQSEEQQGHHDAHQPEVVQDRLHRGLTLRLERLIAIMRRAGYRLLDCQFITDHLASLGAVAMSQGEYLQMLYAATRQAAPPLPQAFDSLLKEARDQGVSPGKLIAQSFTQTS